jgi:hypothetical protein
VIKSLIRANGLTLSREEPAGLPTYVASTVGGYCGSFCGNGTIARRRYVWGLSSLSATRLGSRPGRLGRAANGSERVGAD